MRENLKVRNGERFRVEGIVQRYGGKLTNIPKLDIYCWQETILILNIKDLNSGEILTDHIWLKVGKTIEKLNTESGDVIQFDARVDSYRKKSGIDYHFERPTKFKIISKDPSLFPEEEARFTGTGIAYAKKLKEKYDQERFELMMSVEEELDLYEIEKENESLWLYSIYKESLKSDPNPQSNITTLSKPSSISNIESNHHRNQKIQNLRQAHYKGQVHLEDKLLKKGGFKKVSNSQIDLLLSSLNS
jgi:hypothetical protein